MATGNEQQYVDGNVQVLPGTAVEAMRTYAVTEIEAMLQGLVPDPFAPPLGGLPSFVVGQQIGMGVAAAAGDTLLVSTGAAPTKRRHAAVMEMRDRDGAAAAARWGLATWRSTDSGFASVPTKNLAGEVIQVGLRINDYPSGATTDTNGTHFLDRWTHGIGEHPTILSVTNLAPGLRIKITDASRWRAWSDATKTRPCRVWLDTPETSGSEAYYDGALSSDGVDVYVDVPHWFGQTGAPSLVVGDYTVHVFGLTFSVKATYDLTAQATNGVNTYAMLMEYDVTAVSADFTVQTRVPTLQMLAGLMQNNPILTALRKGLRSGCFIGSYEETRDWNAVANVVVNSGVDPVTITYGSAVLTTDEGRYFFAGDESTVSAPHAFRMGNTWQAGGSTGYVATIAKSQPTGTYAVIAVTEPLQSDPNEYAVQLKVVDYAAPFSDFLDREVLLICTFNFTTGTGAVAGMAPIDLSKRRGISDGTLIGDGDDGGAGVVHQPLITGEIIGAESLDVLLRNNTGTNYAVSKFLEAVTLSATSRALQLHPSSGAGDLSGESVYFYLGGQANDYSLHGIEAAGNRSFRLIAGGLGTVLLHDRSGGEGGAGADRISCNDYHLTGTKGVCRMVPLEGANGDVDRFHTAGGTLATKPRWHCMSEEGVAGGGGAGGPVIMGSWLLADAFSCTVGDEFTLKSQWRVTNLGGDTLTSFSLELYDGTNFVTIWSSNDAVYGVLGAQVGDLAYQELHIEVTGIGATGTASICYALESYDGAASPLYLSGVGGMSQMRPPASVGGVAGIDFTKDVYVRAVCLWAAGVGAGENINLEQLDVERTRTDLWRTNRDDGWYLETGDDRELRIPLPVNVDNDHLLTNAEVWCAVGSGGATGPPACRLLLDLMEYDPTTGNETSLLAAAVEQTANSFVVPKTLTCAPANPEMTSDKRYYIKVITEQDKAGGQFQIRSAQINCRLTQVQ